MINDTKNDEGTNMKTDTLEPITKDSAKTILASRKALLVTSLLTASLLIGGCSNNDKAKSTETAESSENIVTEDTAEQTIVDNTNTEDVTLTEDSSVQNDAISQTSMPNLDESTPLLRAEQPSLVTNPTEPGTPEDTVKQALNTLYYGDVKDAVGYYRVDMEDFETELANTQSAFQQTVESVTITNTQYSVDRIRATITGELKLKGQSEPAPLTYQLRKVGSEWKILG